MEDEKEGVCCQLREVAAEGYDSGQGHHEPVKLELFGDVWNIVQEGWFSTPIKCCPWCGKELPLPKKFELGDEGEEQDVDDDLLDRLIEAVEAEKGGA